jgi:hypothetical protein
LPLDWDRRLVGDIIWSSGARASKKDYIGAHDMSPFEDLGADVLHEGLGLPLSQDHYPVTRIVIKEEGHRGMRSRSSRDPFSLPSKIIPPFAAQV